MEVGETVRVKILESIREGKIETINSHGWFILRVSPFHSVVAFPDQIIGKTSHPLTNIFK